MESFVELLVVEGVTELGGLTKTVNAGIFRSPRVSIYMSPHQSLSGFALTLNHELIHAYHRTLGFVSFWVLGFVQQQSRLPTHTN